jgi:hypothetical protein
LAASSLTLDTIISLMGVLCLPPRVGSFATTLKLPNLNSPNTVNVVITSKETEEAEVETVGASPVVVETVVEVAEMVVGLTIMPIECLATHLLQIQLLREKRRLTMHLNNLLIVPRHLAWPQGAWL